MGQYKIYRYLEPWQVNSDLSVYPSSIIFPDSLNRHLPKKTFVALGERVKTIYFDRFVDNKFIEPIIKIDYSFNRDQRGLLIDKQRIISWRLEDDTWSDQTQTDIIPVTSNAEKLTEIKRRRGNIVTEVAGLSKDIGLNEALTDLYDRYAIEINQYGESGLPNLRDAIANNTDLTWLDRSTSNPNVNVRQFLISYFSIGVYVQQKTRNN